jgi:hypothetical protein
MLLQIVDVKKFPLGDEDIRRLAEIETHPRVMKRIWIFTQLMSMKCIAYSRSSLKGFPVMKIRSFLLESSIIR